MPRSGSRPPHRASACFSSVILCAHSWEPTDRSALPGIEQEQEVQCGVEAVVATRERDQSATKFGLMPRIPRC